MRLTPLRIRWWIRTKQIEASLWFKFFPWRYLRFHRYYFDGGTWHHQRGFRIWFVKWSVRDDLKPELNRLMPGGQVKKDSSPIS